MIRLIRDWQADVVKTTSPIFEPYEYDTTTVTLLQFKGGRIGKVASVIDCLQPYYFHVHLVGSEGSLLDHRFSSRRLKGTAKDGWNRLAVPLVDSGDVADHPYQPQFQAFEDSIARDEVMPLTDYEAARCIAPGDLCRGPVRPREAMGPVVGTRLTSPSRPNRMRSDTGAHHNDPVCGCPAGHAGP